MATSKIPSNISSQFQQKIGSIAAGGSTTVTLPFLKNNCAYIIAYMGTYPNSVGGVWLLMCGNQNDRRAIEPLFSNNITCSISDNTITLSNNYSYSSGSDGTLSVSQI